jgi:hypothetical protein
MLLLVELGCQMPLELGLMLVGELTCPGDQLRVGANVLEHEAGHGVQAVAEQHAAVKA